MLFHGMNASPRQAVLVVDDDPDAVSSLARILRRQGYETECAGSIAAALDRDDWHRYLAVILDRRLPDGLVDDVLHRFREEDPEIAIIVATGFSDLEGSIAALRENVEDYLMKPVNPEVLAQRLQRIAAHREAQAAVRRLEREVLQAGEEEKQRIAMEIHDGLGSKLSAVAMLCQSLKRKLASSEESVAAEKLEEIERLVRESIAEARALSRGLCAVEAGENGLRDALTELARLIRRSRNCQCAFDESQGFQLEDSFVANHLYRIAQEAVHNAVRHGDCSRVGISLSREPDEVVLCVSDDGTGFDPSESEGEGMGLQTMAYRARLIGGTVSIQRSENGGSEVICRIPDAPAGGRARDQSSFPDSTQRTA